MSSRDGTNVFQGLLPTYLYPFQFWVNTTPRASGPLDWKWVAMLVALIGGLAAAVFYSTSSWRLALAERRAEALELREAGEAAAAGEGQSGPPTS